MALSVLNNIPSLVAQNQLEVTNNNLQNTLFQLSSGSRINSGADDPAGLSIINGLQANISALSSLRRTPRTAWANCKWLTAPFPRSPRCSTAP